MTALKYQMSNGASSKNGGKTYAYFTRNGVEPIGNFIQLDNLLIGNFDSISVEGAGGQYDLWCKDLSSMNFNGRTNWRRVTLTDLEDLYANRGPMQAFGWADTLNYGSSTIIYGSYFSPLSLNNGYSGGNISTPENYNYASCASE
jgi:hypothetical protein